MPFQVVTVNDEAQLATALTAVVTTARSEDELDALIEAATNITTIVVKGGHYYTLIDNAQIANVSLRILAKGGKYTYILETA